MGITELLLVLAIIILVFGARRLPALGKSIGQTVNEFKKAKSGNEIDVTDSSKKATEKLTQNQD